VICRASVILSEGELRKNFLPTCALRILSEGREAVTTFDQDLTLYSLKKVFTNRPKDTVSKNNVSFKIFKIWD
jgi:hypothetical protein